MKKTYGELFTGIGGASQGLKTAGYHGSWAVEWNQGAIDILKANHDIDRVIHGDVCEVNYETLPEVDLLWASPVCCSFSGANHKRGETELDIRSAQAIIRAASRARSVLVENVPAYSNSDSFSKIHFALVNSGFLYSSTMTLNAADYGNPSSRNRFYAIFSRSPIQNVELPKSRSNWADELMKYQDCWEPSKLTANQQASIDASRVEGLFAIERCGYYGTPKIIQSSAVFPCIRSHTSHDGKNPKPGYGKIGSYRRRCDFVYDGQSYALTPQLLGVLMGFPIDYGWGENRAQAAAGIGNSCAIAMVTMLAQLI